MGLHGADDLSYAAELTWPPLVVKKFKAEKNPPWKCFVCWMASYTA